MKRSLQFFLVSESLQLLLISSFVNLQLHAQPDSALGFFPLHTDDFWQYHRHYYDCCCNLEFSTFYTERVAGDTSIGDYLVDSLRATEGSEFSRGKGGPVQCAGVDTATVLGTRTMAKRFNGPGTGFSLAYGLGLVRADTMAFECWSWK